MSIDQPLLESQKHEFQSYSMAKDFADDWSVPGVWAHIYRQVVAGSEKFVVELHPMKEKK